MALLPGARLGSYEIPSALGAGGMGEVNRARDCLAKDRSARIGAVAVARYQIERAPVLAASEPAPAVALGAPTRWPAAASIVLFASASAVSLRVWQIESVGPSGSARRAIQSDGSPRRGASVQRHRARLRDHAGRPAGGRWEPEVRSSWAPARPAKVCRLRRLRTA